MDKKNKEVIENAEQEEINTERKEQPDKKKMNRKKRWVKVLVGILLLLCISVIVLQETGIINKHVHMKVRDITEREELSYNNLIFSLCDFIKDDDGHIWKSRHLCIFNTGDVYYLELPMKLYWLSNNDENPWKEAENVIYMGRLSNSATETLNQYVENYDDDESYIVKIIDPGHEVGYDSFDSALSEAEMESSSEIHIFWQGDDDGKKSEGLIAINIILYFSLNNSDHNTFETWRTMLTREENAIAAVELFESTGFYYRWVAMCFEEY